jgi:hypothetical protein
MLHAVDWKNMETAVTRVYKASKTNSVQVYKVYDRYAEY